MKEYSIFDIIGPVMIGPSSSHTAGAARIGYMARKIAGEEIREVTFYLHGSFAKTYQGHGTDRALLAGVMGMFPDDERIRNAFEIAEQRQIAYRFEQKDLGEVHPNTVNIVMTTVAGVTWQVIGSSIGGGKVRITQINGMDVSFEGEYTTLITYHEDYPGVVANITAVLAKYEVNIAFMKLFREAKASKAVLIVETDETINDMAVKEMTANEYILNAMVLEPI